MVKTVAQLKQERTAKKRDADALVTRAEEADRDMTDAEKASYEDMKKLIKSLDNRIARLEDVEGEGEEGDEAEGGDKGGSRAINPAPAVHTRKHEYSLVRALRTQMAKRPLDGLEKELSDEEGNRCGRKATGFFVPHHFGNAERGGSQGFMQGQKRAVTTQTGAGAIGVVTESTLIEYLYNKSVLANVGATFLTGMNGKFSLPRQTGTSTAYWFSEGNAPQASQQIVDQVAFNPQTIGCYTDISRKFLMQSTVAAEPFVRNDLARILSLGIDAAGLVGTGQNNQPVGITNNPNTGVVSIGPNSGPLTWSAAVKVETLVATANADQGSLGYVTSALGRGALKTTPKTPGYPVYLADGTELNGAAYYVSNQIPNTFAAGTATNLTALIFGNWADLVVAMFGPLDILVDPYTGGTAGTLRIIVMQDADIHARHDASFAMTVFQP